MSGQQKSLVDLPPDTKGPHTSGVVNGALEPLAPAFGLTPRTEGIVVSFLTIGAAFGAVIGGRLSDAFGRRSNILLLATFFIVGTLACALAPNWQFLAGARFFLGLAVGAASTTVPVYLAELAPSVRGLRHQRDHLQHLGRARGRVAVHARRRRAASDRSAHRHALPPREPALADLETP